MSPLPVIENCYRITTNFQSVAGCQPHNVWHVLAPSSDVTEVAEAIYNFEQEGLYGVMPAAFEPTSYDVLPLDGESPAIRYDRPVGSEELCLGSGDWIPEAAAVVRFRTHVRGPKGRGRLFVGPLQEAANVNGTVIGDAYPDMITAWQNYYNELQTQLVPMYLAVASYTHAEANPVASISGDTHVVTQRRRLLQQR